MQISSACNGSVARTSKPAKPERPFRQRLQIKARFAACVLWLGFCFAVSGAPDARPSPAVLPALSVSVLRGFHDSPFTVKLEAPMEGAVICFTTDGSPPAWTNGSTYTGPLPIQGTTVLRAAAFKNGTRITAIATHSYLFLDEVMRQPKNPSGLPAGSTAWNGLPSAYEMDPRVVGDPLYRGRMKDALKALPSLSIVCRKEDMFDARTGLYFNSMQRGQAWERPCSAELILPDGNTGFQIDCGIRIQGNYNRIPEKSPKHAFRLLFKKMYGAPKLDYRMFTDSPVTKFDTLVLRADYNNSWIHWDAETCPRAQRTRDAWMKDSHRAMGWPASHTRYLHLYLNGLYWGVYDAAERLDGSFGASYLGGHREDYDVINEFQIKGGTRDAFDRLQSITGLGRNSQYERLQRQLDVTEFIDYLLLNYYGGNQDIGENKNWYALRRRQPPGLFRYLVWDGEQVLQDVHDDTVNSPSEVPFRLERELMANAEYRLAFADRAQQHLFHDGALTPAATAARWMKRAGEVDLAIIAESARWGYYRRIPAFTRDQEWLAEQQRLLRDYFPRRTGIILDQLRAAGLYPRLLAPTFSQHGGLVPESFRLSMTCEPGGSIYYTVNGLDPRVGGTGAISPSAQLYTNPVAIPTPASVKARVWKAGVWSALSEAGFAK